MYLSASSKFMIEIEILSKSKARIISILEMLNDIKTKISTGAHF